MKIGEIWIRKNHIKENEYHEKVIITQITWTTDNVEMIFFEAYDCEAVSQLIGMERKLFINYYYKSEK